MFEEQAVPLLNEQFPKRSKIEVKVLRMADVGESVIAERVESQIRSACPSVNIAYCARPGEVDLRLSSSESKAVLAAAKLARKCLEPDVFGEGDQELEQVVIGLLFSRRKTVAVAESCTGGALANRFTNVPGASEVFLAGWVTYANGAKAQELGIKTEVIAKYGAVSEQVAQAMAEGARNRSGADFALSVTGIAGPHGGTKSKPVGTVFIGLASAAGVEVHREYYPLDRWTFKWRVAQRALNLLRLRLLAGAK
jgi:nicotinamide-nucleotide amidase